MKKYVSSVVLGAMLVTGLFFVANVSSNDLTFSGERHPPIFMPIHSEEADL